MFCVNKRETRLHLLPRAWVRLGSEKWLSIWWCSTTSRANRVLSVSPSHSWSAILKQKLTSQISNNLGFHRVLSWQHGWLYPQGYQQLVYPNFPFSNSLSLLVKVGRCCLVKGTNGPIVAVMPHIAIIYAMILLGSFNKEHAKNTWRTQKGNR